MDDIDAMFSDLLGEMDLLTQVNYTSHHNCRKVNIIEGKVYFWTEHTFTFS